MWSFCRYKQEELLLWILSVAMETHKPLLIVTEIEPTSPRAVIGSNESHAIFCICYPSCSCPSNS